jgi:maltose alpha-D-glucosyltransferase/alpha-amylase
MGEAGRQPSDAPLTPKADRGTEPLVLQALALLSGDDWRQFLAKQRWFSDRGVSASAADVTTAIPLPWGNGALALTHVRVRSATHVDSYQIPLGARLIHADALPENAVVGTVDVHGQTLTVFDAVHDPDFQRGLADALAKGTVAADASGEMRWIAELVSEKRLVVPEGTAIRVGSVEQSNTSIIFDREGIFKLFRKLEQGIHPDVEVNEFLTLRARFAYTPAVIATARFERGGGIIVSGVLQEYLPDSRDAWAYAIESATPYFTAPPGDKSPPNGFMPDAKRLGEITRELHEALATDHADPAFAPERATPEDLDRWAQRTQQTIRDATALLERRLPDLGPERGAEARVLVQRRDQYLAWVNEIVDDLGDDLGARTRAHGDYHLGQVLRTASQEFMVIDFEGEPARPLAERREKTSPLRDVAGMLRSFGYAAATLAMSIEKTSDMQTREIRAGRWERDVRAAFLSGYAQREEGKESRQSILPVEESHVRMLIALFETEKAFYELAYELTHRLDWVGIPMRGISKLLVR